MVVQAAAAAEANAAQQAQNPDQISAGSNAAPEVTEAPGQSRWRPRVSNPFSSIRFPGRNRQPAEQNVAPADPSPSQLEAGTTVR